MRKISGLICYLLLLVFRDATAQNIPLPLARTAPARINFIPGSKGSFNLPCDSAFTLGIHSASLKNTYTVTMVKMKRNETVSDALKRCLISPDRENVVDKFLNKFRNNLNSLDSKFKTDSIDPVLNVEFRYKGKNASGILKPVRQYALIVSKGIVDGIYDPENDNTVFTDFYYCIKIDRTIII